MDEQIELRLLRYFLAVAEELHFGRAAQRLHIAQPPLSQQIKRLEELVGYALFVRSSRSVKLTPAGELLKDRAQRLLAKAIEDLDAVRRVARGEVGSLTIGFVGSAMLKSLPGILGKYRQMYPNVHLRLRETYTSQLVESIRDGSIDVGLLRDVGLTDELETEPLEEEPFIVAAPKGHALAQRKSIRMEQLRHEPFVFFPKQAGTYAWENAVNLCRNAGFAPQIVQEAPHWLTILMLVGAGLGVTIAPSSVGKVAGSANVQLLRILPCGGRTTIDFAVRPDQNSPLVEAFRVLAFEQGRSTQATWRLNPSNNNGVIRDRVRQ